MVNQGGSFLDIVQRCWSDSDTIIEDSMTFSKKLGLIDSDATAEQFMDKFLTMKDWAAQLKAAQPGPKFVD